MPYYRHSAKIRFSFLTSVSSPLRKNLEGFFGHMLLSSWTDKETEAQRGRETLQIAQHVRMNGLYPGNAPGLGPCCCRPPGPSCLLPRSHDTPAPSHPQPRPEAWPPSVFLPPGGTDTNSPPHGPSETATKSSHTVATTESKQALKKRSYRTGR